MPIKFAVDPKATPDDSTMDIDDMNYDSLKEQAEKLDLLKYVTGDSHEEVKEEVKVKPKTVKNSSIKKKKKRLEDDIETLKIQKYNKIREYNQKKTNKKGHRKHGPRVKDNKITDISSDHDSKYSKGEDGHSSKKIGSIGSDKKHQLTSAASESSFSKSNKGNISMSSHLSDPDGNSAKDRVLRNKQKKKLEEQKKKEMELMQICKQNQAANAEARMRAKNQYRPSSAMQKIFGDKKIEEEYSLYDKPIDGDMDDEFLESIIEDVDAEDEEDREFKENIKAIDKKIQEKKIKLEETQRQMQELTLNHHPRPSKVEIKRNESKEFPKTEKTIESSTIKEGEGNNEEESSEDEEELAQYLEEQDDDEEEPGQVYKAFEENQTLVKLHDKIKMLKHRCEAALGYTLFEKAYKLIKKRPEGLRDKLCELIGEDNVGFYVIFDNILFLEKKKKELKNQN